MNELEQIFTEMLNHIDDHKEAYNKPQWTNEAIVKTWVKTNESKLKNLFISGVSQQRELLELLTEIANSDTIYSNTRHKLIAKKLLSSNCG